MRAGACVKNELNIANLSVFLDGWPTGLLVCPFIESIAASVNSPPGFHLSLAHYSKAINGLLKELHVAALAVIPANRAIVDRYLHGTSLMYVDDLMASVKRACRDLEADDDLWAKFLPYIQSEEQRIRKNLESIAYNIDTVDTLSIVTGPGRLERVRTRCFHDEWYNDRHGKHLMPVVYLLLERALDVVKLAGPGDVVLHWGELLIGAESLAYTFDAIYDRIDSLTGALSHAQCAL